MSLYKISSPFPRTVFAQCRNSLLVYARHRHPLSVATANRLHSLCDSQNKVVTTQSSLLHHSSLNIPAFQRFGFSSSSSPESTKKGNDQSGRDHGNTIGNNGATAKTSGDAEVSDHSKASGIEDADVTIQKEETHPVKKRRRGPRQTAFSDSDVEDELSMEDMVKLVSEKEELLKVKHKELETMQDKVLRTYAEMENVMGRTRREAENSKKFAIQGFAMSLLDVADNLSRASSVVQDSFSKIDTSKDTAGAVPLLKTLLEGVEMTDKQLSEVFKKFGVEKYDPTNEQFDPNRHNAVFQVPDASKPSGTIAIVLKAGYMLHDRVLRPAEVGVTEAVGNKETDQGSEA